MRAERWYGHLAEGLRRTWAVASRQEVDSLLTVPWACACLNTAVTIDLFKTGRCGWGPAVTTATSTNLGLAAVVVTAAYTEALFCHLGGQAALDTPGEIYSMHVLPRARVSAILGLFLAGVVIVVRAGDGES